MSKSKTRLGLKYLKDSSSGKTLFNAIREKVFNLGEEVKNNFIGITFDHAKAMTGTKIGLISHLRKNLRTSLSLIWKILVIL